MAYTHSLDDALGMFKLAKVNLADLNDTIQTIIFSDPLINDDIKLVELDNNLAQRVLQGGKLVFRGNNEDFPVLCTENKTYNVKEAETSNSLLLLPSLEHAGGKENSDGNEKLQVVKQVRGMCFKYLELRPVNTISRKRIKDLLQNYPYTGIANENENPGNMNKIQLADLLEQIQGSEQEIAEIMSALPVCQIDGFYRYLPMDFRYNLVSELLDQVEFTDPSQLFVDPKATFPAISHLAPQFVADRCLKMLGKYEDEKYQLEERLVCRFFAEYILSASNKQFILHEFLEIWQLTVPSVMTVDVKFLEGIALVSELPRFKTIEYFNLDNLPETPQQRFDILFTKRQKWKLEDLKPFLSDLAPDQKSVGNLVTKFCRSSIVDGQRLYNSRDAAHSN